MRWESLTMPDFARAVIDCDGVGIIPIGVLQPHSTHMPLGTNMFESHWVACKAAEREPALVFPQYCWGINHEAMHLPGSLVIKADESTGAMMREFQGAALRPVNPWVQD